MEDDTQGVPTPGPDAADAVAQVHAIGASSAVDRAMMNRKRDSVALTKRHDLRSRLHARALLSQHELAAGEIPAGFGQEDCDLQREGQFAVEVLMQAVVVARLILQ